jgi:hypothetical protein
MTKLKKNSRPHIPIPYPHHAKPGSHGILDPKNGSDKRPLARSCPSPVLRTDFESFMLRQAQHERGQENRCRRQKLLLWRCGAWADWVPTFAHVSSPPPRCSGRWGGWLCVCAGWTWEDGRDSHAPSLLRAGRWEVVREPLSCCCP